MYLNPPYKVNLGDNPKIRLEIGGFSSQLDSFRHNSFVSIPFPITCGTSLSAGRMPASVEPRSPFRSQGSLDRRGAVLRKTSPSVSDRVPNSITDCRKSICAGPRRMVSLSVRSTRFANLAPKIGRRTDSVNRQRGTAVALSVAYSLRTISPIEASN